MIPFLKSMSSTDMFLIVKTVDSSDPTQQPTFTVELSREKTAVCKHNYADVMNAILRSCLFSVDRYFSADNVNSDDQVVANKLLTYRAMNAVAKNTRRGVGNTVIMGKSIAAIVFGDDYAIDRDASVSTSECSVITNGFSRLVGYDLPHSGSFVGVDETGLLDMSVIVTYSGDHIGDAGLAVFGPDVVASQNNDYTKYFVISGPSDELERLRTQCSLQVS